MADKKTSTSTLSPLLDGDELRTAFRRRKDANDYPKVGINDESDLTKVGWSLHKKMQAHVWLKKPKSSDTMLEDRIWCLFYRMGYPRLSGPKFRIEYRNNDGSTGHKRIDILAADDETVVVVECRAREARGK